LTQIRQILESRAIDLGNPGKDNKFGVGRLSLIKESAGTRRGEGSTGAQSKKTETLPK
jgi:hypothetical protein